MLTVIFVWKSSFLLSDFLLIPSFKKSCYKDSLHNYYNWKLCNKKGLVSVNGECDNIGNLIQFPLNWRVIFFFFASEAGHLQRASLAIFSLYCQSFGDQALQPPAEIAPEKH